MGNDGEVIFEESTAENFNNCKRHVSSDRKDSVESVGKCRSPVITKVS